MPMISLYVFPQLSALYKAQSIHSTHLLKQPRTIMFDSYELLATDDCLM